MAVLKNTSLAALGALAHRLQCRTTCKIQNGLVWKGLDFLALPSTIAK